MTHITTPEAADLRGNQAHRLAGFIASVSAEIGGIDPRTDVGAVALKFACQSGQKFIRRLGGTTYQYAMWAAVDPRTGRILVIETDDDRGRWMSARCRPWNGGDKL